MNGEIVSDIESDDFTDEEEEQRKKELEEQLQQEQLSTPTVPRRSTASDNTLYQSARRKSSTASSQWYIDMPKNTYLEASSFPVQNGNPKLIVNKDFLIVFFHTNLRTK